MKFLIKLIFIGFVCLISSVNLYSQYLGDVISISSYSGVWKWETEDECLTLYLRDTVWTWGNGAPKTDIIGTYRYVKNNIVVVDNTDIIPSALPILLDMPIYAHSREKDDFGNVWTMSLLFKDTVTGKESSYAESTLSYSLGRHTPELSINLVSEEKWYEGAEDQLARTPQEAYNMRLKSQAAKLAGWSIPNNVVLKKIQ